MFAAPAMWPGHLRLLLRQVVGRELLAPVLLGRAHVDEPGRAADLADHLVAERADLGALGAGDRVAGRRDGGHVLGELAALELPLLAAAVHELHGVEAAELQQPVRVGSEPVVVAAVEDDGRVGADPGLRQQAGEPGLVLEVAADLGVQVRAPVPAQRVADVPLVVGGRVLVDLDDPDVRIVDVLLEPVGAHQHVRLGVVRHGYPTPSCPGTGPGTTNGRDAAAVGAERWMSGSWSVRGR